MGDGILDKRIKIPYISGEWKKLFEPTINGNYVNDHSIVLGPDERWHLFGITSFECKPSAERYFVHGVGESLQSPFKEVGRSIDRGTLAWAPAVIKGGENYYMFYGPSPKINCIKVRNNNYLDQNLLTIILYKIIIYANKLFYY